MEDSGIQSVVVDENESFICFDNEIAGLLFDDSGHEKYPIKYYNITGDGAVSEAASSSYFGYVYKGSYEHTQNKGTLKAKIREGQFFSCSGIFGLHSLEEGSKAVVIEVLHDEGVYPETNYSAFPIIGGPVEPTGRLKYIDGCTDSLLVPPIKLGDPCLNHLHFPKGIDQTHHTHPSHRIGVVTKGRGQCITPFGILPLEAGMIFIIKEWDGETMAKGLDGKEYPLGQHAFRTLDDTMDVIAFHPDSDFGPTDTVHPMINRTIVEGKSASELKDIQTK